MKTKFSVLFLALGFTACTTADDARTASKAQAITARELTSFDANGVETGISWGFVTPPEPDVDPPSPDTDPPQPDLEMLFVPIKTLGRMSEYADVAGNRTIRVTSRAATGETTPPEPDLDMSIFGSDGLFAGKVTVNPPDPDLGTSQPPEPDHVVVRVQIEKSATVEVVDANGRVLGTIGAL